MRPATIEHSQQVFRESLHRAVHQAIDARQPHHAESYDDITVLRLATNVFETALRRNPNWDETTFDSMVARAQGTGLTLTDLRSAFQAAAEHAAVTHEFKEHHDFRDQLNTARDTSKGSALSRLRQRLELSLRSVSFYDSSLPSGLAVQGQDADLTNLAASAVERQVVRKRFDYYMESGGPVFRQTIERYQAGDMTYQELLDHPTYIGGIRRITEALPIADLFVLDAAQGIEIDASDQDVQTAIRRQWAFILKSEVAQVAELRQLDVMSVPDIPEYATRAAEQPHGAVAKVKQFLNSDFPMRISRLVRVVATNATVWSVGGAHIGGQLAMLSMHQPNQWVTAGAMVVGAALTGAGVRLARAGSEASIRQKQRRTEIGLGTLTDRARPLERQLVPDADLLRTALLDAAEQLDTIIEHDGTTDDVLAALEHLYNTIADVQARLRRSQHGNQPPHEDHHTGPARIVRPAGKSLVHSGPARIVRPEGKPLHHKGAAAIVRPEHGHHLADDDDRLEQSRDGQARLARDRDHRNQTARDAHKQADQTEDHGAHGSDSVERFDPTWPKQDYINFGVENRFLSQQQLAEALQYALAVLERAQPPEGKLRTDWNKRMKKIEQHTQHHMDTVQAAIDREVAKFEDDYTAQASGRGLVAGALSGAAIAFIPQPFHLVAQLAAEVAANAQPLTIQPSKYVRPASDSIRAIDTTDREIADLALPDWRDTAAAARTERLATTRPQRERIAREAIRQAVDAVAEQYGGVLDEMQKLLRAVQGAGAITPEQMAALQSHAPDLGAVMVERPALQNLLHTMDEDFTYEEIDGLEGGRLARLVAEVDGLAALSEQVTADITRQLNMLNQEATRVRQLPDDQLDVAARQQQLEFVASQMTALQAAAQQLYPGVLDQRAADQIHWAVEQYKTEINNAVTVMTLQRYLSINQNVRPVLEQALRDAGIIDPHDLTKIGPNPGQAQRLARKFMRLAPTASPGEFAALGFIGTGRIARVNHQVITDFVTSPY